MPYYKTFQTNKYHAKKQFYNGNKYDSKREASKAWELDMLLKAKKIKSWEAHKSYDLYGKGGTKICRYIADFVILHLDDSLEIVDIKAKITATPVFKLKWKLLQDNLKEEIKLGLVRMTIEY